jgi:transposase
VLSTFGRRVGRNAIRRMLLAARLSWKKIKKLLGKAKPEKRAEHITRLEGLFAQVCRGEVTLIYIDESHFHQDLDEGYTWGPKGKRSWRVSTTPGLSERLNWYGAYDFSHGQCLIWEDGPCDGQATCHFLGRVARWRAGLPGKIVVIWDNAPCHIAKVVQAHAEELGIELVALPGYSPDLNPIERLFSKLNAALRSAAARTVDALIEAMGEALRSVRAGDIRGWFAHSGYTTVPSTVTLNEKPL